MRVIWICEFKTNVSNMEQAFLNKQTIRLCVLKKYLLSKCTQIFMICSVSRVIDLITPPTPPIHSHQEGTDPSNPVTL